MYLDARVDDGSFARYVQAAAADIANAPETERRGILYETPDPGTVTAARRRKWRRSWFASTPSWLA